MADRRALIVGAGAAGVFAALRLKELSPQVSVVVLEAAARPLSKVKISGGGRCNVTHACFDVPQLLEHYPRGGRALGQLLRRFGPSDTVAWFKRRGVPLKTEPDGRMFPTSDSSSTIIECFLREAERLGVRLFLRHRVRSLEGGFTLELKDRSLKADTLLLATGSAPLGYRWLEELGHSLVAPVPSLFTFEVRDQRLEGLAGVSVGRVRVGFSKRETAEGPLLITHHGLSGPAVLRLSAFQARALHKLDYRARFWVDFLPDLSHEEVRQALYRAKGSSKSQPRRPLFELPKRLWARLLQHAQVDPAGRWAEVSDRALNRLGEQLKRSEFSMQGKATFKEEFVTAGGLPLKQLQLDTLESRKVPGLFVAGELLDVDGVTGGFNFQNAWASGWVAAEGMSRFLKSY